MANLVVIVLKCRILESHRGLLYFNNPRRRQCSTVGSSVDPPVPVELVNQYVVAQDEDVE